MLSLTLLSASACTKPAYRCASDTDCNGTTPQGQCIQSPSNGRVCAVPEPPTPACASGLRYAPSSGLAPACHTAAAREDVVTDTSDASDAPSDAPSDADAGSTCLRIEPAMAPIAPVGPAPCEVRAISPLPSTSLRSRTVEWLALAGDGVTNVRVAVLPPLPGMTPIVEERLSPGAVTNTHIGTSDLGSVDPRSPSSVRWQLSWTCNAVQRLSPTYTLVLPRPYRFDSCSAGGTAVASDYNGGRNGLGPIVDLDRDGRPDLVISSGGTIRTWRSNGTAIHSGSTLNQQCLTGGGMGESASLGRTIRAIGDADGDGVTDFLLGSCGPDDNSALCTGVAIAYGQAPSSESTTAGIREVRTLAVAVPAGLQGCSVGASLSPLGDVNNDGLADAVIGTPCDDSGAVHLVLGNRNARPGVRLLLIPRTVDPTAQFGRAVAFAGYNNTTPPLPLLAVMSSRSVHTYTISPDATLSAYSGVFPGSANPALMPNQVIMGSMRLQGDTGGLADRPMLTLSLQPTTGTQQAWGVRFEDSQALNGALTSAIMTSTGFGLAGPADLDSDGRADALMLGPDRQSVIANLGGRGPAPLESLGLPAMEAIGAIESLGPMLLDNRDTFALLTENINSTQSSFVRLCSVANTNPDCDTTSRITCSATAVFRFPVGSLAIAGR
ncbi:MAG: VCBS repeat-containing protein [Deltaproteobacteria bacterium]|nr:VCBS repeat-containing protein [Deltaproteobacteria bacterium]